MNEEQKEKSHIPKRLNYIFLFVFLFFAALILRLAFVQLVHGEEYRYESQVMSTKSLPVPAPRGRILDKNGEVLVTNQPVFTVTYTQSQNTDVDEEELANKLSKYLDGMSQDDVYEAMMGRGPKYIPRRIKVGLTNEEISRIVERRTDLPGVNVIEDPLRKIRKDDVDGGAIATHILGYIRQIRAEELDEYLAKGYRNTDRIGVLGLEKYYENQLKGIDGKTEVKVNKDMETIEKRVTVPPVPGNDLILTIDLEFQDKVEQILKEYIEKVQNDSKNPRPYVEKATVVALHPKTGAVLALANYPDYDLNDYYSIGYNQTIAERELNLAVGSPYLVGSTVKPASAMMGLQEGLITPSSTIFDRGGLWVGNTFLRNWRSGGHGTVNVLKAIKVSNNTFFYDLSLKLANYPESITAYKTKFDTVDYYFSQLGLGAKTGIDLPYETSGFFSPYHQLGNLSYSLIGQQNSYTAIQLAQYVSTIANNGYRMRPYLVKEIRKGTISQEELGPVLMKREPEVLNRVDIDKKYIELIQKGMRMVTEQGGTGYWAFYKTPYTVAAKTGTAQNWQGDDHSTLIAYAPYENPEIALAIIVPFGGSGSDTSAPLARQILDAYFGVDVNQDEQ